jgi:asparagine synthase (glutamine-hydrolysing)
MCGIAGVFQHQPNRPQINPELLTCMTDSLVHRGPDGSGQHIEAHVGLGHRRLAVIAVETGQQPQFNEDYSVAIVFNGEIYNFQELAQELTALGHVFRSHSDTEVIVHAWEQWREASVSKLRGMFAYAIWDRNTATFFMARDRLGVKPLYYGMANNGDLVFGSELKALLRHPAISRDIRNDAIDDYFAYGYVPDPKTIFTSCAKLAPAHWLSWTVGASRATIEKYWEADFSVQHQANEKDLIAELRARVNESVKMRMVSEVPIGAFLSGGVDSSAVVAEMSSLSADPVSTCSIGFDSQEFDETEYARTVAGKFSTKHFERTVSIDDFGLIPKMAALYDEPFADSSAIPTFRVCQLARERVTVALSGDGGDETFGGYRRYKLHLAEQKLRSLLPEGLRQTVFGTLGQHYPKLDWAPRGLRAKTTFQALAVSAVEAYQSAVGCVRPAERAYLYGPDFKKSLGGYDPLDQMHAHCKEGPTDPLAMIQNLDYKMYLPGDINVKVDRASMANSLETREPLMDHPLVEWVAGIPSSLKIQGGETKYLFKKSYEGALPNDILYRPKMGFSVPLAKWFRTGLDVQLQDRMRNADFAGGSLNRDAVSQLLSAHTSGSRNWGTTLWTVLMYDAFLQNLTSIPRFQGSPSC